jgi:hypothetical protein
MKNTLELQLRALRPPRVLKKNQAGEPELIDVWAIHHDERSPRQWAIAVKFGRKSAGRATVIQTGTLFTVQGRLDQSKNPKTGHFHTFIWADDVFDLVFSKRNPRLPDDSDEMPELDLLPVTENPEPETPYA